MAFFQKIVATGNGQPPESPFYYPNKLCLMVQKVKYDKENNQWHLVDK